MSDTENTGLNYVTFYYPDIVKSPTFLLTAGPDGKPVHLGSIIVLDTDRLETIRKALTAYWPNNAAEADYVEEILENVQTVLNENSSS